jgi:hypothetical protein
LARKTSRRSITPVARPTILVFGESDNDRAALVDLFRALRPDLASVSMRTMREPLILMKDESLPKTRHKTTDRIAAVVRAEKVSRTVLAVIAHEDCDAVEPAHIALSETIESELIAAGVPSLIAATPAWEIEAWWMLFPAALRATRPCWAATDYAGQHTGKIENAKERLRRDLRPTDRRGRGTCPDYAESDGIKIATNVRAMNLQDQPRGTSESFGFFARKIRSFALGN